MGCGLSGFTTDRSESHLVHSAQAAGAQPAELLTQSDVKSRQGQATDGP